MRRSGLWAAWMGIVAAGCFAAWAQAPVQTPGVAPGEANSAPADSTTSQAPNTQVQPDQTARAQTPSAQTQAGGRLHGMVQCGNIPLPGVTVTAQNTVTGKRYSTTTGINGAWSLNVPPDGHYVIRSEFAGFAPGTQEAELNAAKNDQTVTFALILASRAAEQQHSESTSQQASKPATRQQYSRGAQNLSLQRALEADTETQGDLSGQAGAGGAELPSIAGNSDFGADSVAISGQSGTVSPQAGGDTDRTRDAIDSARGQNGGQGGGGFGGGQGGGGFGGGGGGGFGGGGFGGGRGNFRGFDPRQPHGAVFWIGSNSALNAEPFALRGQPQEQPPSGSNRFGITFMSEPYLPHLTKPSGKDTIFLTLSGTRASTPSDQYATVPTDGTFPGTYDERTGDFTGQPTIIDPAADTTCVNFHAPGQPPPTPGQPFPGNMIPLGCIDPSPAYTLLNGTNSLPEFFPAPNLPGDTQNYHLLTTAQTNTTQAGVRYLRSLGKNATLPGGRGGGRRSQNQGLRQTINFNYNWIGTAADNVNIFPQLGGKTATNSNSLQAGYTVGYHKITSIFNANWNRSASRAINFFTNVDDIASQLQIYGPPPIGCTGSVCTPPLNSSPFDNGLPDVVLSNLTGLSEQQPNLSIAQTISLSETLSWIYGKHNMRFGSDYRRVHRDFQGGSNTTGTFYFTGAFTGTALGDFLLGEPEETSIDSAISKSYLRDNVMDLYALDDWRVLPILTLNYGVRYEFYAPYTEKYGHLAMVDTNPIMNSTNPAQFDEVDEVEAGGTGIFNGKLPDALVYPYRTAVAPRLGLALRLPKQFVLRAGYGINYTVGQYATLAPTMAHQPPWANEQINEASACASAPADCLTLQNGFPAPDTIGNYALDPRYHLPYVQVWNLDVQKTLPWNVVLNIGYNGSKGNHLDDTIAPRPSATSPGTDPTGLIFNYEQAESFSKFNAGTIRVNKRLSKGISLGANYQYSHSIDDAGSVGGTSTIVAQDWQHLSHDEGNSSFDIRHSVSGTYLFELPFGKDKRWVATGTASHVLEGLSVSGSYIIATGTPLNPSYQAAPSSVACGTAGSLRPDLKPGTSITAGAGTLKEWFNPAAFTAPTPVNSSYPCAVFGNASRNSIAGPGTITNNMSLSKTMQLGGTRSMEMRATASNVFNTVQYSGVDTNVVSPSFGQVTSTTTMRAFQFTARFRY